MTKTIIQMSTGTYNFKKCKLYLDTRLFMKNVNSTKELERNEKNSKFVYADEICVCCGNTSLPNDMLCKACKDKADEEKEKK